jgi:hypothetical protein
MRRILVALIFIPLIATGQTKPVVGDVWQPFQYFVGSWKGTGKGEPGISQIEREYKKVLGDKFLLVTHKSTYQPQEKNPKGETHEDWGFFSYDRLRKAHVLRQFHVEGFVTQYRSEMIAPDGKTLVFTAEALENLPAGFRAKETYKIISNDEFVEVFELAAPGKEFAVYSENHFKRQR